MMRGFVKTPHDLLRDPTLPSDAIRLWQLIRQRNNETEYKACWEGAASLSDYLPSRHRRRPRALGPRPSSASSKYKAANRELTARGMLVVVRRGTGQTALRWALLPGAEGELELGNLLDRGEIDPQVYMEIQSRRAAQRPHEGRPHTRLAGSTTPTIQKQENRTTDTDCGLYQEERDMGSLRIS